MDKTEKPKTSAEAEILTSTTTCPPVFISHHAGGAKRTGAYRQLLMVIAFPFLLAFVFISSAGEQETNVVPLYHIGFANFGPQNTDIFVADADGSNAQPFLSNPALDYNASISADGKWILFTSERNGSADIYRAHVDGSGLEQLTDDPAYDDQAALSRDGKKLAFVSSRNGQADIYVLELATKKVLNITHDPAGDFRPSWSPDGKWIAFSTDRNSKKPRPTFFTLHSTEVYKVREDGTELTRLTTMDAFAGSPCWSPDGKQLVMYRAEIHEVRDITVVRRQVSTTQIVVISLSDTSRKTITTGPGEKVSPHWLNDGSIAYVSRGPGGGVEFTNEKKGERGEFESPSWSADDRRMVYHRNLDTTWPPFKKLHGRDPHFQLLRTGIFPSFSPSGKQFICNDQTEGHNSIMVMNVDGTHRSILFTDSVKTALAPVFSPKGDKIAFGFGLFFQKHVGPGRADIAIINSDGSNLKILTDGSGNFGFPSWSPDGNKIVYRASGGKTEGLLIIDVETRMIDTLTRNSPDNFPGWSPKGDLIAFTSKRGGDYDIYTIHPDGHGLTRLTNTPGNDAHSAWSPDGEWIAFSSARGGFKDESVLHPLNPQPYGEIHVMKADGTDVRMLTDNQFEDATPGWVPLRN